MIRPGIWKHSKSGKEYKVIGVAKHSETKEDLVVYEALYDNEMSNLWVRPISMWEEEVDIGGRRAPRFVFIKN